MGETKTTFAQRHPKLNQVLGVSVLAVVIYILYIFLDYSLGLLVSITSNTDKVVGAAFIAGSAAIANSLLGKWLENRRYLSQKREEPYSHFISLVYKILAHTKEGKSYPESEMLKDVGEFSEKLTLWGSNAVIRKWIAYRETLAENHSNIENLFKLEELMVEIRNDMGYKKLKKGELLSIFVNDIKEYLTKS